jgi:hypothetical protein
LTAGFDFFAETFILGVDFFVFDFTVAACGAKSTTVGFAIGPLLKDELQADETTAAGNAADTSKQRDDHNAAVTL